MKKVVFYISFLFMTSYLYSSDIKRNTGPFLAYSYGKSFIDVSKKDIKNNIHLQKKPTRETTTHDFELGYYLEAYYFFSLKYNSNDFDELVISNYLLSSNYKFLFKYIEPYIGLLVGVSDIKIKKSLVSFDISENESKTFNYGLNLGADIPINDEFMFYVNNSFLKVSHKTYLENSDTLSKAELSRENFNLLSFGVKYIF